MFNQTLEKEFKSLCKLIDSIAKDESYIAIDEDTWDRFSTEAKKLEFFYRNDQKNLYYIMHNYHSRLIWKMLARRDPFASIKELKNSCIFLLRRHKAKEYACEKLERMSISFSIKSQDIASYFKSNPQEKYNISYREWLKTMTEILEEL